jgi:hypothetical protein
MRAVAVTNMLKGLKMTRKSDDDNNDEDPSQDRSAVKRWAKDWMIGGSSSGRGWEFFSPPSRQDRLWGTPSPLSNGYQGLFPWE